MCGVAFYAKHILYQGLDRILFGQAMEVMDLGKDDMIGYDDEGKATCVRKV